MQRLHGFSGGAKKTSQSFHGQSMSERKGRLNMTYIIMNSIKCLNDWMKLDEIGCFFGFQYNRVITPSPHNPRLPFTSFTYADGTWMGRGLRSLMDAYAQKMKIWGPSAPETKCSEALEERALKAGDGEDFVGV